MADSAAMEAAEWASLNPRQQAQAEATAELALEFGMFDQSTGANGAHYAPADKNPFVAEGLACSNCIFFDEITSRCQVVAGEIEPDAVCKLWIIPEVALASSTRSINEGTPEMTYESSTRAIDMRAIPSISDGNSFEGRACQFGVVDSYGTTFKAGCFTRGGLDKNTYPLLWQHDSTKPVGTFTAEERADGLWIMGRWDDTEAGQEARMAALSGSATELSVGFSWTGASDVIDVASLREVSQVTTRFASVPGSAMTAVRAGRVLSAKNEEALKNASDLITSVLSSLDAARSVQTEDDLQPAGDIVDENTPEIVEAVTETAPENVEETVATEEIAPADAARAIALYKYHSL